MSPFRSLAIISLVIAALVFMAGCTQTGANTAKTGSNTFSGTPPVITTTIPPAADASAIPSSQSRTLVRLETTMGNITIALDPDMPVTVGNFESLVRKGFYDGVIFHRVIDGFMIQGGDPTGTGKGGPGYTIKDEFTSHNRNDRGTIAMANSGPDTGGSQFFINLVDNNYLDSKHPVFGTVVEGMDVVARIGKVPTDMSDRPVQDVAIIHAVVV